LVPSAIEGGREDPSVEEREADTEVGAINVPEEVGERVELRFGRHENIESVLSKKRVLLKDGVKEVRQRSSVRGGGRRNAMEKGARMGGLPNPDGSKRKRARTIRISMEAREALRRADAAITDLRAEEGGGPPLGPGVADSPTRTAVHGLPDQIAWVRVA